VNYHPARSTRRSGAREVRRARPAAAVPRGPGRGRPGPPARAAPPRRRAGGSPVHRWDPLSSRYA